MARMGLPWIFTSTNISPFFRGFWGCVSSSGWLTIRAEAVLPARGGTIFFAAT
ncbi:UNVERIFIED_CONTAM: hypothetical protein Sradi_0711600 [Sesamum radiatum]|uniref:Uncharacterized protein n=1 Tax=Sesamum radiatum TaxID=300843 RepID=A0AAW2VSQ0_SESRA